MTQLPLFGLHDTPRIDPAFGSLELRPVWNGDGPEEPPRTEQSTVTGAAGPRATPA